MKTMTKILALGGAAVAGTLGWAALADMPMQGGQHGMGMGPAMMQHMGGGMGHSMSGGTGGGMGHGMDGGAMHGTAGHAMADPARIDALKSELGITPAQVPAWETYAKTLQQAAEAMTTAHEGIGHGAMGGMNPADRLAFATKMREQGQQRSEAVRKAASELRAALDDAQKAKAAEILPGLAEHGHGPMHGMTMGGPQHGHPNR